MIAQSLLRLAAVRGALILGLTLAGGPALAADALVAVGDELAVGKNRTGETCRLRLVELRQDRSGRRAILGENVARAYNLS